MPARVLAEVSRVGNVRVQLPPPQICGCRCERAVRAELGSAAAGAVRRTSRAESQTRSCLHPAQPKHHVSECATGQQKGERSRGA